MREAPAERPIYYVVHLPCQSGKRKTIDVTIGRGVRFRETHIVLFHQPNYDAVIESWPSRCSPEDPPRYEPATSGRRRPTDLFAGAAAPPQPRGRAGRRRAETA